MADDETPKRRLIHTPLDRLQPKSRYVTKAELQDELMATIAPASLAVGQKIYDQCSAETARLLEEMEARINARIDELMPRLS